MRSVWIKLVVSAALLTWLLARTPLAALAQELKRLDVTSLAITALLALAAWLVSAMRLWRLAPEFGLAHITRMTFIGLFYGTVLPGQVAGDVVKAYRLSHFQRTPGQAAAATLVDRGVAMLALFAIGSCAAFLLDRTPPGLRLVLIVATLAIALAGCLLALTSTRNLLVVLARTRGNGCLAQVLEFLQRLAHALHAALRHPARIVASLLLAFVFHGLCIGIHLVLGHALGIAPGLASWCLVYAGVSILLLLPISIAGIGLREGGYVGLLALFGVSREAALAVSFALLGSTLLGALIGGVIESMEAFGARRGHLPIDPEFREHSSEQ